MARSNGGNNVERFDWRLVDEPGAMEWIRKEQLSVDHEYQRDKISAGQVLRISREWSWVALGVLTVAMRDDGTLWVIDGQNRKLAADKRDDIKTLPCMVFRLNEKRHEARGFVTLNTQRKSVTMVDKFRALVVAGDRVALLVRGLIEKDGYEPKSGDGRYVRCLRAIMRDIEVDEHSARTSWDLCVRLYDGRPIKEICWSGLFTLERHVARGGQSLKDANNYASLMKAGFSTIEDRAKKASAYYTKGGGKVWADGILSLINHRRTTNKIPSIFSTEED